MPVIKKMIGKIIRLLILFLPDIMFSQSDTTKIKYHGQHRDTAFCIRHNNYHPMSWSKALTLKTGYMYSNYHSAEIGIEWLQLIGTNCDPYGTMGLTVGNDFLFDKKIIYGPKFSAEIHYMIFGTRLTSTYYCSDFKFGSLKIRPEVGLTILGYINVFYGYTFNVSNPTFYNQKHSISVFSNIPILKYYGHRRIKKQ